MYAKPTQLYDNIENGRNEMCIMCNSIQFNSIQLTKCVGKCHLHFTLEKHESRSKHSNQIGNSDNF